MNKRTRRLLSVGGGTATILFLGITGWLVAECQDVAAPDLSDLTVAAAQISPVDNAFTYFEAAFRVMDMPGDVSNVDSMLLGRSWDDVLVSGLLVRNREMFVLLIRALACPTYEPCEPSISQEPTPSYVWVRDVSDLLTLKAMQEQRAGESDHLWQSRCDLLRFCTLVCARPRAMIEYASGMTALHRALTGIRRSLQESNRSESQLDQLLDQLNHIDSLGQGLVRAIRMWFRSMNEGIDTCNSRRAWPFSARAYVFQPNRTRRTCAEFCRAGIRSALRPYRQIDVPEVEPVQTGRLRRYTQLLERNCMGKTLVALLCHQGELVNCLAARCRMQSHLDGLRLVVACRLYELRHGRLPETLDALVPELLPAVPLDPFDGEPFRYSRADAVVYSVGKDLKDSWVLGDHAVEALSASRSPTKADDLVYSLLTPQRNKQPGGE